MPVAARGTGCVGMRARRMLLACLILVCLPSISGCSNGDYYYVQGKDVEKLQPGDPILLREQRIGYVDVLGRSKGVPAARLVVDHSYAGQLDGEDRFFVDPSPDRSSAGAKVRVRVPDNPSQFAEEVQDHKNLLSPIELPWRSYIRLGAVLLIVAVAWYVSRKMTKIMLLVILGILLLLAIAYFY